MTQDKYLHLSALQKAIRRGEEKRALNTTRVLLELDVKAFWRRLHIIGLEDVGIANTDALIATLSAASTTQRQDIQTAFHLVALLCAHAKNRLADSVFIQAERAEKYDDLRKVLARADDNFLTDYVLDEDKPLVERSIALWLLAGTKKFPSDFMPSRIGSLDKAISVLRVLNTPKELTEACIGVIKLTPWPLSLFLPLIWQETSKYSCHIRHDAIPFAPEVGGIPLFACDMFTRLGKSCFSQLRRSVPELKAFSIQQIGLGIFYLDGGRVDNELTSPELEVLQHAGELADLASSGLATLEYKFLRDCLTKHMDMLADIRQEHLQQYVNAIQGKPTFTSSDIKEGA